MSRGSRLRARRHRTAMLPREETRSCLNGAPSSEHGLMNRAREAPRGTSLGPPDPVVASEASPPVPSEPFLRLGLNAQLGSVPRGASYDLAWLAGLEVAFTPLPFLSVGLRDVGGGLAINNRWHAGGAGRRRSSRSATRTPASPTSTSAAWASRSIDPTARATGVQVKARRGREIHVRVVPSITRSHVRRGQAERRRPTLAADPGGLDLHNNDRRSIVSVREIALTGVKV